MSSLARSEFRSNAAASSKLATLDRPQQILIAVGWTVAWVLGRGGTLLPSGPPQDLSLAISSLGLVMSASLLAVHIGRQGHDIVAVGFAVLALGEVVILAAGPASAAPANPGIFGTIASGYALYAVGLALINLPSALPIWSRIPGALAAIPFAIHVVVFGAGGNPDPLHGPLSSIGYMLLTLAIVGWTIMVLRSPVMENDNRE